MPGGDRKGSQKNLFPTLTWPMFPFTPSPGGVQTTTDIIVTASTTVSSFLPLSRNTLNPNPTSTWLCLPRNPCTTSRESRDPYHSIFLLLRALISTGHTHTCQYDATQPCATCTARSHTSVSAPLTRPPRGFSPYEQHYPLCLRG